MTNESLNDYIVKILMLTKGIVQAVQDPLEIIGKICDYNKYDSFELNFLFSHRLTFEFNFSKDMFEI